MEAPLALPSVAKDYPFIVNTLPKKRLRLIICSHVF